VGVGLLMAICATTNFVVTAASHVGLIYGLPAQQVALETTGSLVTLLAGFLVFGRLRRNSSLNELVLVAALAVIALSNVLFVVLPVVIGLATANPAVWAAIIGRLVGSLLFTVAAFIPRVRLRRPERAQGLATIGVLGILVLTVVLPRVIGSGLPQAITQSAGPHTYYALHANPALAVVQIVAAVLALTAAVGYLRRFERLGDEFSGWLAIAAVFAVASHVDYALYPTIYSPQVSLGDLFRFCFYVVLLTGSMREIWSYWSTLASATVAEERRRIARDLHDGLSQELAYLGRNLSGLQGTADEETLHQLRVSVDRASLASRQAVDTVAAPGRPVIADALTEAAGEVAERLGLNLELDLAAGIGMAPARADALVRIACEALTNVARHSGSRQVSLVLRRHGGHVRMRVRDSGRGFDTAVCRGGFGLTSMRDRAHSVGGELRISSEPGAGSQVEATL
jgi:signal transduction histidine kinase